MASGDDHGRALKKTKASFTILGLVIGYVLATAVAGSQPPCSDPIVGQDGEFYCIIPYR